MEVVSRHILHVHQSSDSVFVDVTEIVDYGYVVVHHCGGNHASEFDLAELQGSKALEHL